MSLAASSGSVLAVEALMGRSDPLAGGACGFTALFWAVLDKRIECCRLLAGVEGASASRDKLGRAPLMVAANRGVLWAVEMLIPLSDESAVDGSGRDALMLAAGRATASARSRWPRGRLFRRSTFWANRPRSAPRRPGAWIWRPELGRVSIERPCRGLRLRRARRMARGALARCARGKITPSPAFAGHGGSTC